MGNRRKGVFNNMELESASMSSVSVQTLKTNLVSTLCGAYMCSIAVWRITLIWKNLHPVEGDIGSPGHGKTHIQEVLVIYTPWSLVSRKQKQRQKQANKQTKQKANE